MKKITILLLISISSFAQNKKKQTEIALPLHPFTFALGSYYATAEYFLTDRKSITASFGKNNSRIFYIFSKIKKYEGTRIDIGQRNYLKKLNKKHVRAFYEGKLNFEKGELNLDEPYFPLKISSDSLNAKGFLFAPEINLGIKFVFLKRITMTPSFGMRYYFSSLKTDKLTKNEKYWAYDDWDNQKLKWEDNRKDIFMYGLKRGLSPVPYFNVGFIIKL